MDQDILEYHCDISLCVLWNKGRDIDMSKQVCEEKKEICRKMFRRNLKKNFHTVFTMQTKL